jgi:hypothetical protein
MSDRIRLRRGIFRRTVTAHASTALLPTAVRTVERPAGHELRGSVGLPAPAAAWPAPEAPYLHEVNGLTTFDAVRLDPTSFSLRVTVPEGASTVAPGYSFRLTLTRSPEASSADVAVSDWPDLVVDQRASTGGRWPALPGDSALIASGDTWIYDIRSTVALEGGAGRSMRFAESPSGRSWTATFVELDAGGDPIGAVHQHTF